MRVHEILSRAARSDGGGRISADEALFLAAEAGPHELGEAGLAARRRLHGDAAYFVRNLHLNYGNVCANACRFCAFKRKAGDAGAYAWSLDEALAVVERSPADVREIHVVGGLNPELPIEYYERLLSGAKALRPQAAVKAFTAVEIAHLADTGNMSEAEALGRLMKAGLDALPGGGAEVFSPELRKLLCPEKISGERWLSIHETAHGLGLPTNATLLFGHIETWEERIEHMRLIRELQDRTGGFNCFIPLPYQPGGNPLSGDAPPGRPLPKGPDGLDYLKTMAIARLFLDNVPHLKAYWVYAGIKAAQVALAAGADDFDGTIVEERVGHAAGAATPKGLTVTELTERIRMAGFTPVERDGLFRPV